MHGGLARLHLGELRRVGFADVLSLARVLGLCGFRGFAGAQDLITDDKYGGGEEHIEDEDSGADLDGERLAAHTSVGVRQPLVQERGEPLDRARTRGRRRQWRGCRRPRDGG